MVIEAASPKL